jgi:hypothetical protein
METKFCLKLIKETYIDAKDIDEAYQIAEMMADRESNQRMFGSLVTVYTEVSEVQLSTN